MKSKFSILLSLLLLALPASILSQESSVADNNEVIFNKFVEYIAPHRSKPLETILEHTAQFFLGTTYVSHTLDQADDEQLVINLKQLDCVTYVENVLALSYAASSNDLSFDSFKEILKKIRYRNGELTDYASRLHYTSDWIYDNQKNNLLENISQQLLGVKKTKQINFMSSHRSAYRQLAYNNAMLHKIEQVEKTINDRGGFYYLPKGAIYARAKEIPHMAVIAIVTSVEGLDTSHIGFAYQKEGELNFIHASSAKMEVVIDAKTLSNYCFSQKRCEGIIVAKVK